MKKLFYAIFLLFLSIPLGVIVFAQVETVTSLSPGESILYLNGGNSIELDLNISNAVNITGFDVILIFDERIVLLDDWAQGNFLSNPFCFVPEQSPGYIQIVCTQLNMTGFSGDGNLLKFYFSGSLPGNTTVEINKAELTDLESQLVLPQKVNASITVGYAASAVVGNFLLQSKSDRAGIPVSLSPGVTHSQGPYAVLSIHDLCQNLVFPAVVNNDSYTLTTSQPGYLNLSRTVTVPSDADLTLPPLSLLAGDAVADNAINTADLDAIRDAFGTMGKGISADVNFDGVVDLRDLALAAGNYGLTPAEAYGDWLP